MREFQELNQLLNESISECKRLQDNNASLTEENAVLQTMVKPPGSKNIATLKPLCSKTTLF